MSQKFYKVGKVLRIRLYIRQEKYSGTKNDWDY